MWKKYFKLTRSRARKIEILGYYLLFIVLVWEFIIKNLVMESVYDVDLFYINQKLDYIFQALNHITENGANSPIGVMQGFYCSQSGEFLQNQLFFLNLVESLLKISSTVFIAVGRFYELAEGKKPEKL